jgi:mannose-6-phosphate isomerase-like protein (cupin superfamily)
LASLGENRFLDFGPAGMKWEVTRSTADTRGELFEAVNVIAPGFTGPPVHIHPTAEESYAVESGTLDVFVDGAWRELRAGESVTVPAGKPHTLRNPHAGEVRLLNVHKPALDFERFFRRLHALLVSGKVKGLPPRDLRSVMHLSMLFVEHKQEIVSVKPPRAVMGLMAFLGRLLGFKLPS